MNPRVAEFLALLALRKTGPLCNSLELLYRELCAELRLGVHA